MWNLGEGYVKNPNERGKLDLRLETIRSLKD